MNAQVRSVDRIVEPVPVLEGAGVKLKRTIASRAVDYVDPFLLLDHFGSDNPDDYVRGFPMHPHRGIETVTYMLAGVVDHRDSIGNAGRIGPGDVQWMTAGGGIMHEEMPKGLDGKMEGFQLWVNLPARAKMMRPRYQEVVASTIPVVRRADGVVIRVIAGTVEGVQGPVSEIVADPSYLDITIPPQTTFVHPIPRGHTLCAYVFEGSCGFGGPRDEKCPLVPAPKLAIFAEGDLVAAATVDQHARFLLFSGKPLHEPIARYGPFVMTTREEIQQALRDLQNGTFVYRG